MERAGVRLTNSVSSEGSKRCRTRTLGPEIVSQLIEADIRDCLTVVRIVSDFIRAANRGIPVSEPIQKAHAVDRMNTGRLIRAIAMEYREFIDDSKISLQAALVMIAALFEGPDVVKIAEVTRCSRETVDPIAARLTASGLWKDNRTDYQEWDPDTKIGILRFTVDHMVALGLLRRTGEKSKNGRYVYAIDETSPEAKNWRHRLENSNTHIEN